jgi:hypothetical protein
LAAWTAPGRTDWKERWSERGGGGERPTELVVRAARLKTVQHA